MRWGLSGSGNAASYVDIRLNATFVHTSVLSSLYLQCGSNCTLTLGTWFANDKMGRGVKFH